MPEPDFAKRGGLLPAVAQDAETGQVLMVAYMNREAWHRTLATGLSTYWSTSRGALWVKGETSGHVQRVREILVDCDADALLLRVEQAGGVACHLGYASCFFRRVDGDGWAVIAERREPPGAG
jgi:phosphoribosyl-AMP cyclohydrolase